VSSPGGSWSTDYLTLALDRLYAGDAHLLKGGEERAAGGALARHLTDVLREHGYSALFPNIRVDPDYRTEGEKAKWMRKAGPSSPT
jgi:hypothetical protein